MKTKKGEKLKNSGGLSYTRTRELVLSQFNELGMDTKSVWLAQPYSGRSYSCCQCWGPRQTVQKARALEIRVCKRWVH